MSADNISHSNQKKAFDSPNSLLTSNSPLFFEEPQKIINYLIEEIRRIFAEQKFAKAIIGVSGGVDSSLALYLTIQALGSENVFAYLLPYEQQSTKSAHDICNFCQLPSSNIIWLNLNEIVKTEIEQISKFDLEIVSHPLRQGNLIARSRMLILFDQATAKKALIVGTQNKSEKYLGYFTLGGDNLASLEPFDNLYKTQIIQLAQTVLPPHLANQQPIAELENNLTDEENFGFSYQEADIIMASAWPANSSPTLTPPPPLQQLINHPHLAQIPLATVQKVLDICQKQAFKLKIPYKVGDIHKD